MSSLVIYQINSFDLLCEFDGLVINVNRKDKQIVFFEAKNGVQKNCNASSDLKVKFNKINLIYNDAEIEKINTDAIYKMSVI